MHEALESTHSATHLFSLMAFGAKKDKTRKNVTVPNRVPPGIAKVTATVTQNGSARFWLLFA
jgi:hypothetical protein